MELRALKKSVVFQFLDDTTNKFGMFQDKTSSGIILTADHKIQKKGRWAKVFKVGDEVPGIVPGDYVFLQPLMWTTFFIFEGQKYWKSDVSKVLAISKEEPDITF